MARTKRPAAKRPPAHEVILARLKNLQEEIIKYSRGFPLSRDQVIVGGPWTAQLRDACSELLRVLAAMDLPEQELPEILRALSELRTDVIGVYRAHTRLLKQLSGHSPAHASGTRPKRRRA